MDRKAELLKMLNTIDPDRLTQTDFVNAFEQIIKYVTDLKKSNDDEWTLINSALQMLEAKVSNKVDGLVQDLKEGNTSDFAAIKKNVETRLNAALASFTTNVDSLSREHQQMMNYLYDKVSTLEPGKPGEPGLDADEAAITAKLLGEFQPKFDAEIARIQEELQKVGGTSKIGWGAHPLTLAKSGTVKSKTTRHINFTGAGVSSVTRNPDGTVDVSISGSASSAWSTPVESVNGSTTVFTVGSSAPTDVVADGILLYPNLGYTYSNPTITLTNAPSLYVRFR